MSAIGPGDWVEALFSAGAEEGFRAVAKGEIYCVQVARPAEYPCGECGERGLGLILAGDQIEDPKATWCGECGFRPIYRSKADLIESLKAPAKREGVPA